MGIQLSNIQFEVSKNAAKDSQQYLLAKASEDASFRKALKSNPKKIIEKELNRSSCRRYSW